MKIYISASIPRLQEAHDLGLTLEKAGHVITSYWHKTLGEDSEANYHSTERAVRDLEGVEDCDMFLELVGDSNKSRGGRHCELGIAIALNKQIILIGPDDDCIFTWLPEVYMAKYESIDEFIAERVTIPKPVLSEPMAVFEKHWNSGMLSGSPSNFNSGATAKETAAFNWRESLRWLKTAIGPYMTVDNIKGLIENELGE